MIAVHGHSAAKALSTVRRTFLAAGAAMLVVAGIAAIFGGVQFSLGAVHVSVTSAPRILFQAAVLLLLAQLSQRPLASRGLVAAIAFVLVAAVWGSPARRVGDGFEYLAMALNLAEGQPPSLAPQDFPAVTRKPAAHEDPTWDQPAATHLRGRDGRYDFAHFWMYSLAAAPFVAGAGVLGLHPNTGFTAVNLVLVVGLCWLLVNARAGGVAALIAMILMWWVDKAHAEIFIVCVTGSALLLSEVAPEASLLLLGLATAQMPTLAALLVAAIAVALQRHGRRVIGAALGGAAIALSCPLYYFWRLGIASPLTETLVPYLPPVRAILTPLVDPNLGIAWFAPVLLLLAAVGALGAVRNRDWAHVGLICIGAGAILVAGTQTPNVNHGGTPGMSRYGLWLLGLMLPLAVRGEHLAASTRPIAYATAVGMTVLFSAVTLHPRFGDAGAQPSPSGLAAIVWEKAPFLDNPLPEVFAERVEHLDGFAPVPVATARCEKALIVGTGTDVLWPPQCEPRRPPGECVQRETLCYANGTIFTPAPKQPGFRTLVRIPQ